MHILIGIKIIKNTDIWDSKALYYAANGQQAMKNVCKSKINNYFRQV